VGNSGMQRLANHDRDQGGNAIKLEFFCGLTLEVDLVKRLAAYPTVSYCQEPCPK